MQCRQMLVDLPRVKFYSSSSFPFSFREEVVLVLLLLLNTAFDS